MPSIGDIFVKLGFDVDDAKLKGFDTGIRNLKNSLALVSVEAIGTVYALERIASKSMAAATQVMNMKAQFGVDPKTAMFWETVGRASNPALSTEAIDSSLAAFEQNLVQWQRGGMPKWVANDVHINSRDTLESALAKLGDYVRNNGASPAWKSRNLADAGFDPGLTNALKMTDQERHDLFKRAGGGYDVEKVADAAKAISELDVSLTNLSRDLSVEMAPAIRDVAKAIEELLGRVKGEGADASHDDLKQYWRDKFDPTKTSNGRRRLGMFVEAARVGATDLFNGNDEAAQNSKMFSPASWAARREVLDEMAAAEAAKEAAKNRSQVYKVLNYSSQKEMEDAEKIRDFQRRNDPVYQFLKKGRKPTAPASARAIDDPSMPAIDIAPDGQAGQLINTPQPSDSGMNSLMKQDKQMNPDTYIPLPQKGQQSMIENNIKIDIHAGSASAQEVAMKTTELINTYSQFNNAAVV